MNYDNPNLKKFIEWLATPEADRDPPTQQELAEKLGTTKSQLSVWKRQLDETEAPPDEMNAFIKNVKKQADAGKNPQWARLYWEIMNPRNKELKGNEFSADDYINHATELVTELRDSYRLGDGGCPVCGRPKEVRDEPCVDTESEYSEDREVEALAVPARPD